MSADAGRPPETHAADERGQGPPVGELLSAAETALEGHSTSAKLDAQTLLAATAGLRRAAILAFPERRVSSGQAAAFRRAVERRRGGEPVAYITGSKEFYSLTVRVSPDVLVPRPDTELLVDVALHCLESRPSAAVLDLGTGSGAIALAIKQQRTDLRVTASDCDAAALAVARDNARRLDLDIRFVESRWFEALAGEQFDLVVANPPYVRSGDPHFRSDLACEPRLALDGGSDGLDAYRAILPAAAAHLAPDGVLALEHGYDQRAQLLELAAASGLRHAALREDLAGVPRVAVLRIVAER